MRTANGWNRIEKKVMEGKRLSPAEGVSLLSEKYPFLELGALADWKRFRLFPERQVTFVIDANPNYTNVCDTGCHFCAFFRRPGHPEAYTLTVEQVLEKIGASAARGATTVLLQGGHNRGLPLEYYEELLRETARRYPGMTPHFFSAPEIRTMAEVSGRPVPEVLKILWNAGQRTLPGGGAEVLSRRVRREISPKKGGPEDWLEVHRVAHRLGYRSTATLMFGHVETPGDVVEHWDRLRNLQDETGGFTAFIPWSFKPGNTALEKKGLRPAGAVRYLRILAASRLYLDNFPHVQASWFSEGRKTGQAALRFGADDFGGTVFDENVHAAAGHRAAAAAEEVAALIREAGFVPVQRDTLYKTLKIFPGPGRRARR
ncbi:MAG TPA: cyclic dehypoxanthinyl futalosine synthase [Elusimicrobiota bacterium]|nr:cyclic dehypoxanthinyl futalosine synthase [Elusimicrobiota bacterium]